MNTLDELIPFRNRLEECYRLMPKGVKEHIWLLDPDLIHKHYWLVFDRVMVYAEHVAHKSNKASHSLGEHYMWLLFKNAEHQHSVSNQRHHSQTLDEWLIERTGNNFMHTAYQSITSSDTIDDYHAYKSQYIDDCDLYDQSVEAINYYLSYYFYKSRFSRVYFSFYAQELGWSPGKLSTRSSTGRRISYNDTRESVSQVAISSRSSIRSMSKHTSRSKHDKYLVSGYIWDACCCGSINVRILDHE